MNIFFNEDAYEKLKKYLLYKVSSVEEIFILVDESTKKHCIPILFNHLNFLYKSNIIEIQSGEQKKNIYTCVQIWKKIEKNQGTRNSLIINLGGGVITDIGGFVASVYKRGIRFINIPTTLLGMVDAAIGYKNGINLNSIKNEIGSFHIPELLVIDINFLNTLNHEELSSGIIEMFKHGLIADKKFWLSMKKNYSFIINETIVDHKKIINNLIHQSIIIKQKIVGQDMKEKGLRKILNFGHTIGHAIESFSMKKNKIMHGQAVANGIIYESWISYKMNQLSFIDYQAIKSTIFLLYPIKKKFSKFEIQKLFEIMKYDKKNDKNKINFSLLKTIGSCSYNCNIPNSLIKKSFFEF